MTSVRLIPRTVKNNTRPRMVRALLATLFLAFAIGAANSEAASANKTDNTKLEAYYNVEKPNGAPDWSLNWTLQFLFPR